MEKNYTELEIQQNPQEAIASIIGECIDPHVKTSLLVDAIADVTVVETGERVYSFQAYDTQSDVVYDINPSTGAITQVEVSVTEPAELKFKGLQTNEYWISVHNLLNSEDRKALARRKVAMSRELDSLELRIICNAILDGKTPGMATGNSGSVMEDAITAITPESGDDLYQIIAKCKEAVQKYGDKFLALMGNNVKNAYDTYDIDQSEAKNFNPQLDAHVRAWGIDVQHVYGDVKWVGGLHNISSGGYADDGAEVAILHADYMIFEALNSRIGENGKPIKFIRRKVSPDIAALMGAQVDNAQRATMADKCPANVSGARVAGVTVYALESIIWAITNAKAITKTPDLTTYLAN